MIVLARRKAVVDEQDYAAFERCGQRAHERARGEVDFSDVAARQVELARGIKQCAGRRSRAPFEVVAVQRNAALFDAVGADGDHVHGHRVEHFVADHDRRKRLRQFVEPRHACRDLRHGALQQGLLALPQVGAGFEDQVALRQAVECGEFARRRSRASLPLPAPSSTISVTPARSICASLARERAAEQSADFRRGDKVAVARRAWLRRRCSSRVRAHATRVPCSARS